MADRWYFSWNDREFGPFSGAQLKELAALGRLQAMDTVWKEGTEKRVRADRIKNLFPDPITKASPAKAIVPAYSSSIQQAERLSSSIPNSEKRLDSWLPLAKDLPTLCDPEIPDELMLRSEY
jgi:GYF domain 2